MRISAQILGSDGKRLHLAQEMFSLASRQRAATQELMYLHIDLTARRFVPWLLEVRDRVDAAAAAHAQLAKPDWAGCRIAMPALSSLVSGCLRRPKAQP